MDELNKLRKKVLDLEKDNRLFKETEKKLQAANLRLQASGQQLVSKQETLMQTQRIARVGSWEWDVANDTVNWSDELFQIFRLNPKNGAVSYNDHPKIYLPDSMLRLDKAVQQTLETGESYKLDLEIIRGDGTNAFCTAQGYAKKDAKGKVVRLYGSLQDITERKNAEVELKKSEERLKTVIDNNPFPIAVVDEADQHIQYWSKSAIQLFGHNPKTSEEWYQLAYPNTEYREQVIERWKPFLETARYAEKAVNTGEYEICCKNGSVKICEIYAQFIPGALIVTLNDITERKKNEENLKKIEWLLLHKKEKPEIKIPEYGDLTSLNKNRTILDSVGKEVLNEMVSNYLSLLETSAAVYEKNGDYAVGIFSSEWCQFLDCSSRALCNTRDNKKALESGKWLCHESCWADASIQSIRTNKAVDIECSGGLHIYAIPIRANNEVIGSINFGYGNPPTDETKLAEIASNYNVSVDKLRDLAQSYETRPVFIIDIAKEKLETSAKLIGNLVERNQLKEDLLRNQKRYEKAQALGQVGNWEYDPVSTKFWASDEAKRIYGYDLNIDDFSTEMVESCIPERERVHQALLDLLEQNEKYDLVFDIITQDKGIRKTIRSVAEIERDAKGNPLKIIGVISDITHQEKANAKLKALNKQLLANDQQLTASNQQLEANEQQLKAANQQLQASEQQLRAANESLMASEKQFRDLFNSMQEGVYLHRLVYDNQGNACDYIIKEANPISEEYLNIKREDAIGKLATELFETKEAPFLDIYSKVANTGKPVSFEHYYEPINKYFLISVFSPQKGDFATVFLDITERKQAEKIIEESENKYRALYNNAPLSFQSLDENGCFIDINPMWTKTLGYEKEEVIGKWFGDFLHEDYIEDFKSNFSIFKKRGCVSDVQFRLRTKDNTFIYVSFEGCAGYTPEGKFKQTYCVFKDITEQKALEKALINAKEKAEESDRLKSAFLANMSHEIRTPMNGILGFSSLLKEPKLTGEQQKKYIDIIEKSGTRMLNIINDIIDISKIEAGLMELHLTESDVNEQIEYIYTFFKPEVEAKGIKLSLKNTLPAKEAILKTDREKVFAILTNLVKNAIKYTNAGLIEIGYSKKDNDLEFFVKDTGIGIRKDRQESIFHRFIQAEIEDKMARQGAGLGLTITKAYVEMLGGKIWVESKEGVGSTFYFTIPNNSIYKSEFGAGNDANLNLELLNQKLEILIAEDDESSLMLLEIMVEGFCKKTIKANTGIEAVEECRNNPEIDLVFMDIQMPEMNGYEAARQIRKFNKKVVIIAQTAYGLVGDKEKSIAAGCNDYIAKPIKKDELEALIKKHIKQ